MTLAASWSIAGNMSVALTTTPLGDSMVFPGAMKLLSCLDTALSALPNKPANVCLRPGTSVPEDVDLYVDLCCEGLAYVRVFNIFPIAFQSQFPQPSGSTLIPGCGPATWAATLEMGVLRCAPTGSSTQMPSCSDWTRVTETVLNDAKAMRDAACCFLAPRDPMDVALEPWEPVAVEGGCTGGMMRINVTFSGVETCGEC